MYNIGDDKMSLYYCEQCGLDKCFFPKVFIAVNDPDLEYPYHRSKFETKYDEFYNKAIKEGYSQYHTENNAYVKAWKDFWDWLGEAEIKWFCSNKCAEMYIDKIKDG